jgi:hypothetical protein
LSSTQSYKRPVVFELQGAQAVGDALDAVRQAVGEVVHGIDAPAVAGAVVAGLADAVQGGVAHDQVGMGHVDLGPQHPGPVFVFAGTHALEQVQVFLDAAVTPGAVFSRFGEGAPVFPDFVGIEVLHVGLAGPNELDGKIEELFEIIRCIVQAVIPAESHPADIIHDGVHILHVLFGGVGVVESQVAGAVVGLGDPEVQADGFGVADVQVAVGFRGKPGGQPAVVFIRFQIRFDDGRDEVGSGGCLVFGHLVFPWQIELPERVV